MDRAEQARLPHTERQSRLPRPSSALPSTTTAPARPPPLVSRALSIVEGARVNPSTVTRPVMRSTLPAAHPNKACGGVKLLRTAAKRGFWRGADGKQSSTYSRTEEQHCTELN
eukprot:scaffold20460_cov49-Phaeocystis_antarctica.AAC.2